ncbi:unnamed protein product, partial [Polarella glacialis]
MAMAQQPPPAPMRAPGEVGRFDFEPEVEDGLRSATFEMGDLNDGDKVRLTAGTAEARQLMQRDGLTFDEARLQIVRTRMALMGVDSSGMPLDPKTFTFDKVDHGRLPKPLRHSGVDRPGKDFGLTALGSRRVWASLSSPAKAKAAFQNFHLPRFFAERSDDLSGVSSSSRQPCCPIYGKAVKPMMRATPNWIRAAALVMLGFLIIILRVMGFQGEELLPSLLVQNEVLRPAITPDIVDAEEAASVAAMTRR